MKTFVSRKNIRSSSYFLNFSTFKILWFFAKRPHEWGENTISRNIDIWYAAYSKISTFGSFEAIKFFLEKPQ